MGMYKVFNCREPLHPAGQAQSECLHRRFNRTYREEALDAFLREPRRSAGDHVRVDGGLQRAASS
jgi:hypothetical protein